MKFAVIQVRGGIGLNLTLKETLKHLHLPKKHSCVLIEPSPTVKGMLIVLKDYVTWGEIDQPTLKLLIEKRGRLAGSQPLTEAHLKESVKMNLDQFAEAVFTNNISIKQVPGMKHYFRLKPPTKGFESKGIKLPFSMGGALGYRKNHINDLLRRMI